MNKNKYEEKQARESIASRSSKDVGSIWSQLLTKDAKAGTAFESCDHLFIDKEQYLEVLVITAGYLAIQAYTEQTDIYDGMLTGLSETYHMYGRNTLTVRS